MNQNEIDYTVGPDDWVVRLSLAANNRARLIARDSPIYHVGSRTTQRFPVVQFEHRILWPDGRLGSIQFYVFPDRNTALACLPRHYTESWDPLSFRCRYRGDQWWLA